MIMMTYCGTVWHLAYVWRSLPAASAHRHHPLTTTYWPPTYWPPPRCRRWPWWHLGVACTPPCHCHVPYERHRSSPETSVNLYVGVKFSTSKKGCRLTCGSTYMQVYMVNLCNFCL